MFSATQMYIPSPPINGFSIGPVTIHFYALAILTGIVAAWAIAKRRYQAKGGDGDTFETILLVAIVFGILGARAYHVITDYQMYFCSTCNPIDALKIWEGGLGIWGAVMVGSLVVWLMCRRHQVAFSTLADSIAPALLVGQAIGRLGNWFNQELYGSPTSLPWGLKIDPQHRPRNMSDVETFHPTFLYEMLWNFFGAALLVWLEKKFRLGRGKLITLYVSVYSFGRFWVESIRIDAANHVAGIRVNSWMSLILFLASLILFFWLMKNRPGYLAPNKPNSETSSENAPEQVCEKENPLPITELAEETVATESGLFSSEKQVSDFPAASPDDDMN